VAVILDTSFLIDHERGNPRADDLLASLADQEEPLLIPSVVAVEYLAGVRNVSDSQELLRQAGEILDFTFADAAATAELVRKYVKQGRFPGILDAMIAGLAKSRGDLRIVTANPKHFPESRTIGY
jgi:predicted nucleic acid-binding protein